MGDVFELARLICFFAAGVWGVLVWVGGVEGREEGSGRRRMGDGWGKEGRKG